MKTDTRIDAGTGALARLERAVRALEAAATRQNDGGGWHNGSDGGGDGESLAERHAMLRRTVADCLADLDQAIAAAQAGQAPTGQGNGQGWNDHG